MNQGSREGEIGKQEASVSVVYDDDDESDACDTRDGGAREL